MATKNQLEFWRGFFAKTIAGGPTTRGFDTYFGTDVPNWPPFRFSKTTGRSAYQASSSARPTAGTIVQASRVRR